MSRSPDYQGFHRLPGRHREICDIRGFCGRRLRASSRDYINDPRIISNNNRSGARELSYCLGESLKTAGTAAAKCKFAAPEMAVGAPGGLESGLAAPGLYVCTRGYNGFGSVALPVSVLRVAGYIIMLLLYSVLGSVYCGYDGFLPKRMGNPERGDKRSRRIRHVQRFSSMKKEEKVQQKMVYKPGRLLSQPPWCRRQHRVLYSAKIPRLSQTIEQKTNTPTTASHSSPLVNVLSEHSCGLFFTYVYIYKEIKTQKY